MLPINIENLLDDNVVEWARIEFKKGWNPDATLKTISAFANDVDNWGGGYIVIGAEEENGRLIRPVSGLSNDSIDHIQKELLKYCNYLKPKYIPQSEPVQYDGKTLSLVWCPGGYDRSYQCSKKPTSSNSEGTYYIRRLSTTIEALELDVKELMALTHNIPFDDRINIKPDITDLKFSLLRNYLQTVNSNLLNDIDRLTIEEIADNGAHFENVVAQQLTANGLIPYFCKKKNVGELDFVVEIDGKVVPIEVKSGKDYKSHKSLNNYMNVSDYHIEKAYVLSTANIEQDGKIIYLPIYMCYLLKQQQLPQMIISIDTSGL